MLAQRFAPLHQATIAVEVSQNGRKQTLRGTAIYDRDPDLGSVLKIKVRENWGDFEIILREDEFEGEIMGGGTSGCKYQICLSSDCVCSG
jgi:hypothetical protein